MTLTIFCTVFNMLYDTNSDILRRMQLKCLSTRPDDKLLRLQIEYVLKLREKGIFFGKGK